MTQENYEPIGIWDKKYRGSFNSYLNKYAEHPERATKRWGLNTVFWSLFWFLVASIVATVFLVGYYFSTHPADATQMLKLLQQDDQSAAGDYFSYLLSTKISNSAFIALPPVLIVSAILQYIPWIGTMLFATYFRGVRNFFKEYWVKFKLSDIPLGIGIAWGLIALESLLFALLPIIFPGINLAGSDNSTLLTNQTGAWAVIIPFVLGGLVGPIVEELYFRGFIMQGIAKYLRKGLRTKPNWRIGYVLQARAPKAYERYIAYKHWLYHHKYLIALIFSASFFGILHLQPAGFSTAGAALVPVLTGSIGLVLGFIALKTKRLGLNIVVHIAFNTSTLLLPIIFPGS
jgi:membrane protease YdiL (CAAX protease family)